MKAAGRGSEYDCLIGVSGGVDSTYTAYVVRQMGLRPLAVHFDNGWNSELATSNIERTLRKLNIDLYTFVVDWPEFRDLQLAFLRASTPDGEVPTDHAINALMWKEAARRGIRFVISGLNFATESVTVPHWAYGHIDWRYIKDVHRRFGTVPLRTYPHFSLKELFYINAVRGVRIVSILNYLPYDKKTVLDILENELGWVNYGGKHYESIYTRFYQAYVLPKKFHIDKRYGHLSNLINSGQMSRDQALAEIRRSPCPEEILVRDRPFVIKKLGLTEQQFEDIMALPIRSFRDYRNNYNNVERLRRLANSMRSRGWYAR
jgi:N-acetyl sugar amidotransferase